MIKLGLRNITERLKEMRTKVISFVNHTKEIYNNKLENTVKVQETLLYTIIRGIKIKKYFI